MFNQGLGLGSLLKGILFGGDQQARPRPIPPYALPMPTNIYGGGVTGTPTMGGGSVMNPVVAVANDPGQSQQPPQPAEDPLARFERLARLMDLGERVGSAFDKQPSQVVSVGGGLGSPQLPRGGNYGLNVLGGG